MDAHDYARVASLVAAERQVVGAALARFRTHNISPDWRGHSSFQANAASDAASDTCQRSLVALDDAEWQARLMWRAALTATHPLGL
jgi:hypothetical protein